MTSASEFCPYCERPMGSYRTSSARLHRAIDLVRAEYGKPPRPYPTWSGVTCGRPACESKEATRAKV